MHARAMQSDTTITRRQSSDRNIEIKQGVEGSVVIAGDNNVVVYVAGYRRLENEDVAPAPAVAIVCLLARSCSIAVVNCGYFLVFSTTSVRS